MDLRYLFDVTALNSLNPKSEYLKTISSIIDVLFLLLKI